MSDIETIENAMRGDQPAKVQPEQDYVPVVTPVKQLTPEKKSMKVFRLVTPKKGTVIVPHIDYVIDPRAITTEKPNGNGPEMIRLLSGVTTIWAKEQKHLTEDYIRRNARCLQWEKGTKYLHIPDYDVAALEWVAVCNHNVENKNRVKGSKFEFFEYDANRVAQARYEKELLEIEMIGNARDCSEEEMKKHAVYLGISLMDEFQLPKKENTIRLEYVLAAKRDPERFKKTFKSQAVEVQYKIRQAIVDARIDVSRGDNKIYWGQGGGLICSYPKTDKPLQVLTDLALQKNEDGKQFLERLNEIST